MTEAIRKGIQRILVAFDNSVRSGMTLETAAELAADLQAELHGLFVEDENLIRLAEMPFACEIGGTSALSRPLTREVIERTFRAKAEEAKQALIENARRVQVQWDFQVCRGQLLEMTFAAAEDADVTIVEPKSTFLDGLHYAGRRLDKVLPLKAGSSSLSRGEPAKQIMVIVDGSKCAFRALQIALQLSLSLSSELIVFLAPMSGISMKEIRDLTETWLHQQPRQKASSIEVVSSMESITGKLRSGENRFRLALLTRTSLIVDQPLLQLLIQHLHCPLALVR